MGISERRFIRLVSGIVVIGLTLGLKTPSLAVACPARSAAMPVVSWLVDHVDSVTVDRFSFVITHEASQAFFGAGQYVGYGISFVLTAGGLVLDRIAAGRHVPGSGPSWLYPFLVIAISAPAAVGALIATRRPRNPIGWVLLAAIAYLGLMHIHVNAGGSIGLGRKR